MATGADADLLVVADLRVSFFTPAGEVRAVGGLSYRLARGQTLGIVGESGCGKTVAALALLGLIEPPGRVVGGSIRFAGTELTGLREAAWRTFRGRRLAMVFQEPQTALNPVLTIGTQVEEVVLAHRPEARKEARKEARAETLELLRLCGIPGPRDIYVAYPHQLSGGMRQRALIAMALAGRPELLIADEPTSAVDVTVQAQLLELWRGLQQRLGMAVLFISHDLGVISEMADHVLVMYAGRAMETAPAARFFAGPRHPYAAALLATRTRTGTGRRLPAIPGTVPSLVRLPPGCAFANRCPRAQALCCADPPPPVREVASGHLVACHFPKPG